jgi:hypothetical protein
MGIAALIIKQSGRADRGMIQYRPMFFLFLRERSRVKVTVILVESHI